MRLAANAKCISKLTRGCGALASVQKTPFRFSIMSFSWVVSRWLGSIPILRAPMFRATRLLSSRSKRLALSPQRSKEKGVICHLANSGGVAYYPDSYFDMVRPGLLAYGYYPDGKADPTSGIAPSLSLKAKISYFKVVQKGAGVSYGHVYRTKDEARIVTVPVGYGDGYRRSLSKSASVLIRGERFSIAGAICMDQFMVDIGKKEVYVGEEVVLIGKQGSEEISLFEVARHADSIPHEILSLFNDRLARLYL